MWFNEEIQRNKCPNGLINQKYLVCTERERIYMPNLGMAIRSLTDQINVVINCTPIHVKIKSKRTNLMKITRMEGYNGKHGSNPEGMSEISDDLFEFDQIG